MARVTMELHEGRPPRMVVSDLPGWAFEVAADGAVWTVTMPNPDLVTAEDWHGLPWGELVRTARLNRMHNLRAYSLTAPQAPRTPRGELTPEFVGVVREVYRRAAERGIPPRRLVAEHFQVSEQTAGRWFARLRGEGLLGSLAEERAAARKERSNG